MSLGLEIPARNRKRTATRELVWPTWAEPGFVQAVNDYIRIHGTLSSGPRASKRTQNKFIAERLRLYTGLVRTRTQVSSHLQQRRGWFKKVFGTTRRWDDAILSLPAPVESASPCTSTPSSSSGYTPSVSPVPAACMALPVVGHLPQPSTYADDYFRSSNLSLPWSPDGFPAAVPTLQYPSNSAIRYEGAFPHPPPGPHPVNTAPSEYVWSSGALRVDGMTPGRASCYALQPTAPEYAGPFVWPASF